MAEMKVAWDMSVYDSVEDKLLMWLKRRVDECRENEYQQAQAIAFTEVAEKVEELYREESCIKAQNDQGREWFT